jgi:hypothetical protein
MNEEKHAEDLERKINKAVDTAVDNGASPRAVIAAMLGSISRLLDCVKPNAREEMKKAFVEQISGMECAKSDDEYVH